MELINLSKDSQPLVPKEKAPMAKQEDFRLLPNGGGPQVNGEQREGTAAGGSSTDIPLMDDPDNNDDKFNMNDPNKTDGGVSITMLDSTELDGYNDTFPNGNPETDDADALGPRFGDAVDGAVPADDNIDALGDEDKSDFNNVKHLTQGMMDVALLSANANQLRIVLESSHSHPYYVSSIVLISTSLICQVVVGITLIMDYQYHISNQPQKARVVSRMSMLGIFLIIIINVFIAAFSVASPVVYRPPELTTTT